MLLLDGPEHLRQRRLLLPPFHGERMRKYGEMMAEIAERQIAAWPRGEPFAVLPSMQAITLEMIMRAVFGVDEPGGASASARRCGACSTRSPAAARARPRADGQPTGRAARGRRSRGRARRDGCSTGDPRAPRRARTAPTATTSSRCCSPPATRSHPLSDDELRDELMTLLVAGHETTATALAWTLERLVRHPAVLERLIAEQRGAGTSTSTR